MTFRHQMCYDIFHQILEIVGNSLWSNRWFADNKMEVNEEEKQVTKPPLEPVTKKLQLQTRGRVFGVVRESYLRWKKYHCEMWELVPEWNTHSVPDGK